MPKKNHCDKHYRYVATCPDCKAMNEKNTDNEKKRRYYQDQNSNRENQNDFGNKGPEIPNNRQKPPSAPDAKRFKYVRPPSPDRRKKILIGGIVGLVILCIAVFYIIPLWYAKINLKIQLYETKSSGLSYWTLYSLNYWSTSFIINKIGLIGAIIGCLIMSLPPENNLIALLGQQFNWGRPSKKKTFILWWTGGFVFFFLVGQAIETGYFGLTMLMMSEGKIDPSFGIFFRALGGIFNPSSLNPIDLFVYRNVTRPIIVYICVLVIIRIIIKIAYEILIEKNEIKASSFGSVIISIFFFLGLTRRPFKAQNSIDLIQLWSIVLGLIIFITLSIVFFVYAKKQEKIGYTSFPREINKTTVLTAVALIIIILIPVFIAIPRNIDSENDLEAYEEYIWDVQYQKELAWTRSAAGIEIGGTKIFQIESVSEYPSNVISSDAQILNVMRQFDKEITAKQMQKSIKSSREDIADSDIVYIDEGPGAGEYWVAPKTLPGDLITQSNTNQHTEIFDYVNGFIAIDTSTGEQVDPDDYEEIFGVSSQFPIFFGEKADISVTEEADPFSETSFSTYEAYENDILLYTTWRDSKNITYDGNPDGTLSGLQGLFFTMNMGLYSQAFESGEKSFLINRNIKTRVQDVLLPGMKIDSDPYLVFNNIEGKLYYGLSVYSDLNLGGYAKSSILRFLGTVLVDVSTGELIWYRSPQNFGLARDDIFGSLWDIYVDTDLFPWISEIPDWLKSQIRYPEDLWEQQLVIDYRYHITEPITWVGGDDFYKNPEGSDVYYIESDLGSGLEFVGTAFVEYDATGAEKLAGLYMIRHGDHFGEVVFYRAGKDSDPDLIGPNTAKDQLDSIASQYYPPNTEPRIGNTILYPIANSLYYYIPIYSQTENSGLENLIIAGLVNAFDKTTYIGDSLQIVYTKLLEDLQLNDTDVPTNTTSLLDLVVDSSQEINYDTENPAEFDILISYPELEDAVPRNLTLNITIYSSIEMDVLLYGEKLAGAQYDNQFNDAYNYTIKTWDGEEAFYPSDIKGFTLKINPTAELNSTILAISYKIDLIDLDSGEIITTGMQILTFLNY